MTSYNCQSVSCGLCGVISDQIILVSTNAMGYPDLDLRPPPMKRFTLQCQIQECPSCGYCAPDISQGGDHLISLIHSDTYLDYLSHHEWPDLVRRYLASAYLHGAMKQYQQAFFLTQKASWVCDDMEQGILGSQCRRQAIEWMIAGKEAGDQFWDESGLYELVLGTLYRRTADFVTAMEVVGKGLLIATDPVIISALLFTRACIDRWDTLRYSFEDIPDITTIQKRSEDKNTADGDE